MNPDELPPQSQDLQRKIEALASAREEDGRKIRDLLEISEAHHARLFPPKGKEEQQAT